jgi:D-methionine transport system substrate-binding protein
MRTLPRLLALVLPLVLLLSACGGGEDTTQEARPQSDETEAEPTAEPAGDDTEGEEATGGAIRVGFIPGPYADMFREGILPLLEADGYTVDVQEFSDFTIPNQATMDGDLDMTIFQNDAFMNLYNESQGGDLVSLLKVPSAPLGLYAGRGTASSVEDIEDGAVFGLTSEASNLARSLAFLESLGLLTVGEVPEGELAALGDIQENPRNLTFELLDAPQIPRALPDLDYAAALGNHVYAAENVELEDALALEEVPEASQVAITVREENADSDYADAVVAAFQSEEFRTFIENHPSFSRFHMPDWWS